MLTAYRNRLEARSAAILRTLDTRLDRIVIGWLIVAAAASALRIIPRSMIAPVSIGEVLPYLLLVLAPFASFVLALRWFASDRQPQPQSRLSARALAQVSRGEAERHPLYGTSGIMVSLLVGMMLNVPVRAAEYLAAMPPMPASAPRWLSALHFAMTFDVVLFGSLYMIAFVAALRRVPLFPRLLAGDLDRRPRDAAGHRAAGDRRRHLPPASRGRSTSCSTAIEEGADQHRAVAALPAAVEAGERHLPAPRPGLANRSRRRFGFRQQNRNEIRPLACG